MAQPTRETTEVDSSTTDTETDTPEWLAAEPYDPDADLRERVRQLVEMESDVDVCAADERGFYRVLGQPQEVKEVESGAIELSVGPSQFNWQYEVVVPKPGSGAPFVRSVDPDQDYESYIEGRETVLRNADIRIYNVDEDRLNKHPTAADNVDQPACGECGSIEYVAGPDPLDYTCSECGYRPRKSVRRKIAEAET